MIDFEQIKRIYKFSSQLSISDINLLLKEAKSITFQKKEYLLREGDTINRIYYIRKGIIRSFHINEKGEETTFRLAPEHHLAGNMDMVLFQQPSRFYYEALETTKVYALDYNVVQELVDRHPTLSVNRKFVFQKLMREAHRRIESFVLLSPEERYLKFLEDYPNIQNRVPDKYIANTLGITPVSLSRIRKRIAEKR